MFVGEAPGRFEDEQGLPFVGRAGKLLASLLGEVGLERDDVYIANVLKCRPPANRDPRPEEISACAPFLDAQIDIVDPEVICTLGNFATQLLLARQVGITRLRGERFPFRGGRSIVPTYHPAALLRGGRPNMMADSRSDFALLAAIASESKRGAGSSAGTRGGEPDGTGSDGAGPESPGGSGENGAGQLGLF